MALFDSVGSDLFIIELDLRTEEVETEPTEPPEVVEKTDEPDGANKNYTLDDTIDSDTDGSKFNNSTNSNTTR